MPETAFPIRLADFKPTSAYPGTHPRPVERVVVAGGRRYLAYAWIGPSASARRRAELEAVVSSLAFPPLEPGRTVGYGFLVLERANRYPVGSFTARWDRLGRVIERPAEAGPDDPLYLAVAKLAWDGHVLLHPGTASYATGRGARLLWPGWR